MRADREQTSLNAHSLLNRNLLRNDVDAVDDGDKNNLSCSGNSLPNENGTRNRQRFGSNLGAAHVIQAPSFLA